MRDVELLINNRGTRSTISAENSEIIVRAIFEALHMPVSAAVKAIVINTVQTGYEIYGELVILHQTSKVDRRIQLHYKTAERINTALVQLEKDGFDVVVRQELRDRLIEILRNELERQS